MKAKLWNIARRTLCLVLALLCCSGALPVFSFEAEAATETAEQKRIFDTLNKNGHDILNSIAASNPAAIGVLTRVGQVWDEVRAKMASTTTKNFTFSANGEVYYIPGSGGFCRDGNGGTTGACPNCSLKSIVEKKLKENWSNWIGKKVGSDGNQCNGFVKYAFARVFGSTVSSVVDHKSLSFDGSKKATWDMLVKENKLKVGSYFEVAAGHFMMYLSHDSSGVTVFEANGDGKLTIRIHKYNYSDAYCRKITFICTPTEKKWNEINDKYDCKHPSYSSAGVCTTCNQTFDFASTINYLDAGIIANGGTMCIKKAPFDGAANQNERYSENINDVVGIVRDHESQEWYMVKYGTNNGTTGYIKKGDILDERPDETGKPYLRKGTGKAQVDAVYRFENGKTTKVFPTTIAKGTSIWLEGYVYAANGRAFKSATVSICKGGRVVGTNTYSKSLGGAKSFGLAALDQNIFFSGLSESNDYYTYELKLEYTSGETETITTGFMVGTGKNLPQYTVTLNPNNGGEANSITVDAGTGISLADYTPEGTQQFLGWATSAGGSVAYQPGDCYTANANVTLYAVWQPTTYTVRYDANGGTGAPANQTKTHGQALTLSSTTPTRTGYIFKGWGTSSGGSAVYQPGENYVVNAGVTLYAVWEQNAVPTGAQIVVSQVTAAAGDTVDVTISLKNNPGVASMILTFGYDSQLLTLIDVTDSGNLGEANHSDNYSANPYTLTWSNDLAKENFIFNGEIATLTFRVAETAETGTTELTITYDYDNWNIFDVDGKQVRFDSINGAVTIVDVLIGDVNEDGRVNAQDRMILARYLAKWTGYTESSINMKAADVNQDGRVNAQDRMILARYLAKWKEYPTLPHVG